MRFFIIKIAVFCFGFFSYSQESEVISVSTPDHINWIAAKQVIFYDLTDFNDERIKQVPYLTLKVNTTDTTIINNALRQIKHTKELTVISDSLWSFGEIFSEFKELKRVVFKCPSASCPWEGKFKAKLGHLSSTYRWSMVGKTIYYGTKESELDNLKKPLIFVSNGNYKSDHNRFSLLTDFNDIRIREAQYLNIKIYTSDTTIINYALRKIKHVKELYIECYDTIRFFDGAFLELEQLKRVVLKSHGLEKYPEKVGRLEKVGMNVANRPIYGEKQSDLENMKTPLVFVSKMFSQGQPGKEGSFNNLTDLRDERIKRVTDIVLRINTDDTLIINDALKQLKHVKLLDIYSDSIRYFGEGLVELEEVEHLILTCNKLQKLPDNIGKLSNLKMLQIDRSKLTELPESIINIDSLASIIIRQANFSEFPSEVLHIKNGLFQLILDIPNIVALPENFSTLKYQKLEDESSGFIHLSSCSSLVKLPPNIRKLNFDIYLTGAKSLKDISSLNKGNQSIKLDVSGVKNRLQVRKIFRSFKNTENLTLKIEIIRMFPFPRFLIKKDGLVKLHLITSDYETKQKKVDRLQKKMPNTEIKID